MSLAVLVTLTNYKSMMKENIGFLSYAVITIVLGVIASIIGTFIYDYFQSEPLFSSLPTLYTFLVNGLVNILTFKFSFWHLLVFLFLAVSISTGVKYFSKVEIPEAPEYANYTEEQFHEWTWRWNWEWNPQAEVWEVTNLTPYCSDCNVRLVDRSNNLRSNAECPSCNERFSSAHHNFEHIDSILSLIYSRIENNNFETQEAS